MSSLSLLFIILALMLTNVSPSNAEPTFRYIDIEHDPADRPKKKELKQNRTNFKIPAETSQQSNTKPLSEADKSALEKTKNLLTNSNERDSTISKDKDAAADLAVKDITNDKKTQDDIYKLSAEKFNSLVGSAEGDPNKMREILEKAQKDPEAFANSFSDEQKETLKNIGEKVKEDDSQMWHKSRY